MSQSVIEYKGYGKGSYSVTGIYAGYITGSGNYVNFFIPMLIPTNAQVQVTIHYANIYKDSNQWPYTSEYFDLTYVAVTKNSSGLSIELKWLETHFDIHSTSMTIATNLTITIN